MAGVHCGERARWRDGHALPPASLRFDSPYDADAHYCVKNGRERSGYRAHLTECCDRDRPEIVVHATATIAPVQDGTLLEQIHGDLAALSLLPAEHLVALLLYRMATCALRGPGGRRARTSFVSFLVHLYERVHRD